MERDCHDYLVTRCYSLTSIVSDVWDHAKWHHDKAEHIAEAL
jgi:hypothetical protein